MVKHVLYIEDEESDAFLLKYSFQQLGLDDPFQLLTDGEQAIAYLSGEGPYADRDRFPFPCFILLDLNLPKKNGFEFLEWRREHPEVSLIPVVIFSSSSNPDDIRRAYQLGAAGYLTKLTSPTDWSKCARAIRDFWLEHNLPPPACPERVQ